MLVDYTPLLRAIRQAEQTQHRALSEHLDRVRRRWRIMFIVSGIILAGCVILAINAFK